MAERKIAGCIGISEAVVLADIEALSAPGSADVREADDHHWLRVSGRKRNEEFWPWASRGTIQRILAKLVKVGLLYTRKDLNQDGYDRTYWYAGNYPQLVLLENLVAAPDKKFKLEYLPEVPDWHTLIQGDSQRSMGAADPGESTLPLGEVPQADPAEQGTMTHSESSRPGVDVDPSGATIQDRRKDNDLTIIQESWPSFLEVVADSMTRDVFRSSFQHSSPAAFADGTLLVSAANERSADWINTKVNGIAAGALSAVYKDLDIQKVQAIV